MRLLRAAAARGVRGVVVTHEAQLASWADRVVFLRDGRVVDQTVAPPGPESLLAAARPAMTTLAERVTVRGPANGGVAARRAIVRWAWRMFRREWRQQILVIALLSVAVAAAICSVTIAHNCRLRRRRRVRLRQPPASGSTGPTHEHSKPASTRPGSGSGRPR